MIPSAQVLTVPTSLANYKSDDISSTALSLISSSILFLSGDYNQMQEEERMAHASPRPRSRNDDAELWFSMPSNDRRHQEESRGLEQSAFQVTSNQQGIARSPSPNRYPSIPVISTPTLNKPLPPSQSVEKKRRKPASLRSLIRRRPSDQLDPSHLTPEPYHQPPRSSSSNGSLNPEPHQYHYHHQSSRSMPSSPANFMPAASQVAPLLRAQSANGNYSPFPPYSQTYPQQRSVSMNISFEQQPQPLPPRVRRTFPEANTLSNATVGDTLPDNVRPNSWASPTEAFGDASEFHLFVEATSGLPDGGLGFDAMSPTSPPRLQGSLFARNRQNDRIPIPLQNPASAQASQSHQVSGWQNMSHNRAPSPTVRASAFSSSALPRPEPFQQSQRSPTVNAINLELERLGLSDEEPHEDELPDYAQSQAEMSAKRREAATARARELEARWNSSRGWMNR